MGISTYEMTIAELISLSLSAISLLLAVCGGFFVFFQWRNSTLLKRADYVNELTEKIRTDSYISEVLYLLDYGDTWYTSDFHYGGKMEKKVDRTLSFFSYVCYLKKRRIISQKEFTFFEYEVERTLMNPQVQDYLYNLYHFSGKFNIPMSFNYLFEYGKKRGFFEPQFFDKSTWKAAAEYHHYLNF